MVRVAVCVGLASALLASCSFPPRFVVFNDTGDTIRIVDGPRIAPGARHRVRFLIGQVNAIEAGDCTYYYRTPDLADPALADVMRYGPQGVNLAVRITPDMEANAYRYDPETDTAIGTPYLAGGFPIRPSSTCPSAASAARP